MVLPARELRKTLAESLKNGVVAVLGALGIATSLISQEVAEMHEHAVAATASRSVLGSMNDFSLAMQYRMHGRADLPLVQLALELADTPCGPLKYEHPAAVARAMLERLK